MITKKDDIADMIKSAVSESGKPSKEIIEENSYKVKTSVVKSGKKTVDFDDGPVRQFKGIKENLAEWTSRDFALYIKAKYKKTFKSDWEPTVVNVTVNINAIKEGVYNVMGFCDNVVLKEYEDYFFSKWAVFHRNKSNNILYINRFKQQDALVDFAEHYDYNASIKKYKKITPNLEAELKEEDLRNSYLLGTNNLVLDYGIVISCNWLMMKNKMSLKHAANEVAKSAYKLFLDGLIERVLDNTKKYSPYPDWMVFQQPSVILSALSKKTGKDLNIDVSFSKKVTNYNFLKEKK